MATRSQVRRFSLARSMARRRDRVGTPRALDDFGHGIVFLGSLYLYVALLRRHKATSPPRTGSRSRTLARPRQIVPPQSRRRKVLFIAVSAVAVAVLVGLFTSVGSGVKRAAPPFSLESLQGGTDRVELAEARGRVVLINFWASWCAPCRREMPVLESVHRRMHEEVAVIGVNTGDRRTDAQQFLAQHRITYASGYDPSGAVGREYRLFGMPTTVFLSEAGRVLEKRNGEVSIKDIQEIIRRYTKSDAAGDGLSNRNRASSGFVGLINRDNLSVVGLMTLLVLGAGFGAVHALGPGHGKTLMAAYVVGAEGRIRDAVLLGGVVSMMHTASVMALALLLAKLDRPLEGEAVYHGISVLLGVAIAAVGARLLWRGAVEAEHFEATASDGHTHGGFRLAHHHSHVLPEGITPMSRAGLVALAVSGGLFPSPSALLLLVTAIALGRAALGLALVAAFSLGLAVTLSAIGVAIVHGRGVVERRGYARVLRLLPLLGGTWLVVIGAVLAVRSAASM